MAQQTQDTVAYCPECGAEYDPSFNACPEDGAKLYQYRAGERVDDPLLGEVIDERFRIEEVLGEGGMGKVYLAIQLSVDRPVALKVLHKAVGKNEDFIKRFLREARVISGFNHPNIVRLVDFGQDMEHDLLYLVMEMVEGTDLGGLLERGRLRVAMALEITAQVCAALSEPHAHQVVHRDLKPDNLMLGVTTDGSLQVKVLDFGIAQAADGNTKLTKTGMVHGTPKYMAPEQARGDEMSGRTDIYSLGIILFQMLVGHAPFSGDTAMQIVLQHVQTPAPDMRQFVGTDEVPDSLVRLVGEMIRKAPEQRPASVLEVRDRIEIIQRELDLPRVRLQVGASAEEMFEPWLLDPLDFHAGQPVVTPSPADGFFTDDVEHIDAERALAETQSASAESLGTADASQTPAPSAAPPRRKSKLPLVLILLFVLVLLAGGAVVAFLLVAPQYEYIGPGSKDAEYVWPWSGSS